MQDSFKKDGCGLDISKSELDEVHEIATRITTRKLKAREKDELEQWLEHKARALLDHSVAILGALFALLLYSFFGGTESMRDYALVFGVFVSGILLAACFLVVRGVFPIFNRVRRNPYAPLLQVVHVSLETDFEELEKLLRCKREAVALYLVQYRIEKEAFERRGGMIAGALDKVGFFPAIATFVGVATSLWAHAEVFVRVLVFVVPAFYLMNFASWMLIQEMTRTVAMLEHCIKLQDEIAKRKEKEGSLSGL